MNCKVVKFGLISHICLQSFCVLQNMI